MTRVQTKRRLMAFSAPFAAALVFALVTRNAWEDWFITYRSSKNLAEGYGLVYDIGARVHSFTSPLGTLIPAALAFILPAGADDAVLWVFRVIQCGMLGFGGVLLLDLCRGWRLPRWPAAFLFGMVCLDAKTLDFSTNGMETGFLVFFILLAIKTTLASTPRKAWPLGIAWAGLMWTCPDGVVYIVALCCGQLAFPGASVPFKRVIGRWLRAGAWTILLYGPWLAWTQYYYGSFVPHSLAAKALGHGPPDLLAVLLFPVAGWLVPSALDLTFTPAYFNQGGWPAAMWIAGRLLALACCFVWPWPRLRPATRAMSLATLVVQLYLTFATPSVFPWYMPGVAVMSLIVLALALAERASLPRATARALVAGFSLCGLCAYAAEAATVAYQIRVQQAVVEDGNRRPLGLWLRAHAASPRDTVLLEPLGYIGFFSNLRMYGFPGQSSPELVAARRAAGCFDRNPCFSTLIAYLQPDWLVLRPDEAASVDTGDPRLLTEKYHLEKTFGVSRQVASHAVLPGRGWLQFDETFLVYHRGA